MVKKSQKVSKPKEDIPKAEVVQYPTEESAFEAVKDTYGSDKIYRLNKEEKDYWVIEEVEEEQVKETYYVYKNGAINKANGGSPEHYRAANSGGISEN